jgi:transcriptional antiterminator RfaH
MDWYLVRIKSGKEKFVHEQLSRILPEAFLPLLEARIPRWGKMARSIVPLFPCYMFAQFDLQTHYFDVKYLPGVQGIVSAGSDPLTVPLPVIEEIRRRVVDGVVKIEPRKFENGERVRLIEGPLRGFEAIFERYLSGPERVALLLGTVETNGVRIVMPSSAITRCA